MTNLTGFARLIAAEHGLCVVSTARADSSVQSSVVNAGVLAHPVTGDEVIGFVVRPGTRKLANLRLRPRATIVARVGWEWAAAEGPVEFTGPGDALPGLAPGGLAPLLRAIFTAAGGRHDDWAVYDRVMAEERRTAVLMTPDHAYTNS